VTWLELAETTMEAIELGDRCGVAGECADLDPVE
jgi:hypothetical protein